MSSSMVTPPIGSEGRLSYKIVWGWGWEIDGIVKGIKQPLSSDNVLFHNVVAKPESSFKSLSNM
jgi:hypothetical protein